jgi:hypothetical protein
MDDTAGGKSTISTGATSDATTSATRAVSTKYDNCTNSGNWMMSA